jgi:oligoendopeptidase F
MFIRKFLSQNVHSKTETTSLPSRKEIEEIYKWNLGDIFESEKAWQKEFDWILINLTEYKKFTGTLSQSADQLYSCLKFDDEVGIKLERLYLYAMLAKDSDMRVTKFQAMDDRIKNLFAQISTANSFIRPEMLAMPEEKLLEFINQKKELGVYRHYFDDLLRTKKHTLSPAEEKILALSSEVTQAPYNAFSMFTNADLKFPIVKDDQGKDVEISHGRYYAAMYSQDREFRQRAYKNYYKPFKNYTNTFAALLNGNLKANIFNAKARNYHSAREAALDKNNIPLSVYDNLVEAANKNLGPLHRWAELKKRLLKVDDLHPYDTYVTLFSIEEKKYEYEDAKKIVLL